MTREEAIKQLEDLRLHCRTMIQDEYEDDIWVQDVEALDTALTALRPVSREQVEKSWRGEWKHTHSSDNFWTEVWACSHCGFEDDIGGCFDFCPSCGAPMTDEAVQMVLERLEALHENIYNG